MSTGSGAHEPEVLLVRHLPGLSTRDLRPVLETLLGEDAVGLSATNIGWLTAVCVEE